ncbi:putative PEP-binding protein, partial [uncultured Cellulomonas sp.]|uniref:putative PEP-binding protein n=1 Tax=uncultured Cellulomonas sp. TaxID=189682 RepID=UPI0028E77C5A
CGEAAADPVLAPVLVGLGVASLSMTPRALPDVGAVLATVTLDGCRALAELALAQRTADEARSAVRTRLPVLDELGL